MMKARDLISHCADLGFLLWGEVRRGKSGWDRSGTGNQEIFPCLFTFNSKGKRQEFHLVLQEVRKANFENFFVRSLASILTLGKKCFFNNKKVSKKKISTEFVISITN